MAEQYFINAEHDLVDSVVSFYDERKRQLLGKYSVKRASEIYVRFVSWVDLISDAQDLIKHSRGSRESKFADYNQIQTTILPDLDTHYRAIVRDEILFTRKAKLRHFVGAFIRIGGLIGWIAGLLSLAAEWDKAISNVKQIFHWLLQQ